MRSLFRTWLIEASCGFDFMPCKLHLQRQVFVANSLASKLTYLGSLQVQREHQSEGFGRVTAPHRACACDENLPGAKRRTKKKPASSHQLTCDRLLYV